NFDSSCQCCVLELRTSFSALDAFSSFSIIASDDCGSVEEASGVFNFRNSSNSFRHSACTIFSTSYLFSNTVYLFAFFRRFSLSLFISFPYLLFFFLHSSLVSCVWCPSCLLDFFLASRLRKGIYRI